MNDMPVYLIFGLQFRSRRFPEGITKDEAVDLVVSKTTKQDYDDLVGYIGGSKPFLSYPEWIERLAEQARWDWTQDQQPGLQEVFKLAVERERDAEMRAEHEATHPNFVRWLS